jgi:hypothetical protein
MLQADATERLPAAAATSAWPPRSNGASRTDARPAAAAVPAWADGTRLGACTQPSFSLTNAPAHATSCARHLPPRLSHPIARCVQHLFTSNPQVPYGSLPPPPGQGLPGMPPHGQPHPQYGHPGMPPHGAAFGGQPHHPHTMPPHQPGHMQSMSGVPMAHHPHPSSHPHTMPPHHMGHPGYPGE